MTVAFASSVMANINNSWYFCPLHQLQIEKVSFFRKEGKYWGLFQASRCIHSEEGLPAFWKGHVPAQLLSITFGAVQVKSPALLRPHEHAGLPLFFNIYCMPLLICTFF